MSQQLWVYAGRADVQGAASGESRDEGPAVASVARLRTGDTTITGSEEDGGTTSAELGVSSAQSPVAKGQHIAAENAGRAGHARSKLGLVDEAGLVEAEGRGEDKRGLLEFEQEVDDVEEARKTAVLGVVAHREDRRGDVSRNTNGVLNVEGLRRRQSGMIYKTYASGTHRLSGTRSLDVGDTSRNGNRLEGAVGEVGAEDRHEFLHNESESVRRI